MRKLGLFLLGILSLFFFTSCKQKVYINVMDSEGIIHTVEIFPTEDIQTIKYILEYFKDMEGRKYLDLEGFRIGFQMSSCIFPKQNDRQKIQSNFTSQFTVDYDNGIRLMYSGNYDNHTELHGDVDKDVYRVYGLSSYRGSLKEIENSKEMFYYSKETFKNGVTETTKLKSDAAPSFRTIHDIVYGENGFPGLLPDSSVDFVNVYEIDMFPNSKFSITDMDINMLEFRYSYAVKDLIYLINRQFDFLPELIASDKFIDVYVQYEISTTRLLKLRFNFSDVELYNEYMKFQNKPSVAAVDLKFEITMEYGHFGIKKISSGEKKHYFYTSELFKKDRVK